MMKHLRTVWLSDIHLGTKDCKAELLLNFLKNHQINTLYLVGDIVDFWALKKQLYWPNSHQALFKYLLALSQQQTQVIYIPGNHDSWCKSYHGMQFEHVKIYTQYIHQTAQGRQFLVLHGDMFDAQVCCGKLYSWLGDKAYDLLLFLNRHVNYFRRRYGYQYLSLASYIKTRVAKANQAIARFRHAALQEAERQGLDGVICGHIHHPEIWQNQQLTYYNDGDWVENCSVLTENHQGEINLLFWQCEQPIAHTTKHQIEHAA